MKELTNTLCFSLRVKMVQARKHISNRVSNLLKNERGDVVAWVVGAFVGILLLILAYTLFKPVITDFINNTIKGKMDGIS